MQRASTILQYLTFRSSVSFNDPVTPDGKLWNSALKYVTQTQGWIELHWGTRVASEEVVDLLISWRSHAELQHFMAYNYRPFLNAIEPLLLDSSSNSIPIPYIIQLKLGMPDLELGAVSSLYELSFNPELDPDVKTGLGIQTQQCRYAFRDAAQGTGDGDLFLGIDAIWVEHFYPTPSAALESAIEIRRDRDLHQKTLLVVTEWACQDGEKMILDCGRREDPSSGEVLTTGEYFARNILQKANGYTKHHVTFENVSKANVEWLDKEEKWSTYVARLLAEEDEKRKPMVNDTG